MINLDRILNVIGKTGAGKGNHIFSLDEMGISLGLSAIDLQSMKILESILMDNSVGNAMGNDEYFKKTKTGKWELNASSSQELRKMIAQISFTKLMPIERGEDLYLELTKLGLLKSGDFIPRESRNNEFWFKQSVGNCFRPSKEVEKIYNYTYTPKTATNPKLITSNLIPPFSNSTLMITSTTTEFNIGGMQPVTFTTKKYVRDPQIAKQIKVIYKYQCFFECDMNVMSFETNKGQNYLESHHLIPMANQPLFKSINLDVINNLVSLCPKHHRELHHSIPGTRDILLNNLFMEYSKTDWFSNIIPTIDDLKKLY
ncbi:MAG: hypothetical protein KAG91_00075 [Mycoplasmataceae bacterium]|nr:hypothetical protein [Mycoplasmataceae bacterium]